MEASTSRDPDQGERFISRTPPFQAGRYRDIAELVERCCLAGEGGLAVSAFRHGSARFKGTIRPSCYPCVIPRPPCRINMAAYRHFLPIGQLFTRQWTYGLGLPCRV